MNRLEVKTCEKHSLFILLEILIVTTNMKPLQIKKAGASV